MKRRLILFFSLCLLLSSAITADAKSPVAFSTNYIEYFSEDLYAEVEVFVLLPNDNIKSSTGNSLYYSTKQKTASKTYKIKNTFGTVIATYTLTATFQYNGSSSSCTEASCSTSVTNSSYYFNSKSARKSGNTAIGSFTLSSSLQEISKTLTLTCTSNGLIQ